MKMFVFYNAKINVIQCLLMYTPIEVLKMNIYLNVSYLVFKIDI